MRSYTHFTLSEREKLLEYLEKGKSLRQIAKLLGRAPSSISREIKRNGNKTTKNKYTPWRANSLAVGRSRRKRGFKRLSEETPVGKFVRFGLSCYWSPETIVNRWREMHPEDNTCFSTIYRWLRRNLLKGFSRKEHLRRRGKRILSRNFFFNSIQPDRLITDWPDIIKNRLRIGDWEGDTVCGSHGKGAVLTFVDRKTRYLRAKIIRSKRADETCDAIIELMSDVPVYSISLDNGAEFAEFHRMEEALNAPVYFAHPYSPWERGTNENTNGLLRFFFPKGCNFLEVTDGELQRVVDLINNRPRKCLNWRTPAEVFCENCVALD